MSLADHDRLVAAEAECIAALDEIERMIPALAMARQIVGLRDDRLKKEVACLVAEFLKGGDSATAAEWKAKADPRYAQAVKQIMRETADAQAIIERNKLLGMKYDNAQAVRNDERAKMRMV
jgi:hypothetical protein